jgi:hypothetical protein
MAKSTKSTGTSRIKLIVLDAEVADDQIHTLTSALTNALRGPISAPKRLSPAPPQLNANGHATEDHDQSDLFETLEEEEPVDVTPAAPKAKKPRRVAPKPQLINDLDINSEPELASIGTFKSNHKRYLAIAAWLHDHRGIEVIDERHIYTCYRHLGWPTNIADFAQPLRELKHKQYFESPETGKYAINQLGLAKAKESSAA